MARYGGVTMDQNTAILPLITVGIVAHNAEAHIETAIRCALAQNWRPLDIFVVNDASTDKTAEILEELARNHPELRIVHHPKHKGITASRNTVMHNAQGVFLAFFGKNDQSDPRRIEKQYIRIVSYEEKFAGQNEVLCHTAFLKCTSDGKQRTQTTPGTNDDALAPRGEAMAKRILYNRTTENGFGSLEIGTQMARLKTYQSLNGFDESFSSREDIDFNVRFALNGGHFVGIAEPVVKIESVQRTEEDLNTEETDLRNLMIKHAIFVRNSGVSPLFCARWQEAKYEYLRGRKISFLLKMLRLIFKYPRLCYRRLKWTWAERRFHKSVKPNPTAH